MESEVGYVRLSTIVGAGLAAPGVVDSWGGQSQMALTYANKNDSLSPSAALSCRHLQFTSHG